MCTALPNPSPFPALSQPKQNDNEKQGSKSAQHLIQTRWPPRPDLDAALQRSLRLPLSQPSDIVLGLKIGADRVLREFLGGHEGVGLVRRVEVVDLRLEQVPVGVLVIDGVGGPVVDAPGGLDALGFALAIRQEEIR
jgi:hypothetical protein